MRTKVAVLLWTMTVLPTLALAYPAFGGGKGLFRVQNAMVEPEAGVTVSLHALARRALFSTSEKTGSIIDLVAPELSYAPVVTKYAAVELFGAWGGSIQKPKSDTAVPSVWGLADLKAGAKVSVPILPVLKLGSIASYTLKSRPAQAGWRLLDPSALPEATRLTWGGLVTLRFQDLAAPAPNLILNGGKHISRLTPHDNETYYGAAAEMQGAGFAIFVEASSRQPDRLPDGQRNRRVLDTKYGQVQLTPGIALGSPTSAFLKIGYTFSLGGESLAPKPSNELVVGLGYATPFGRQDRPHYGRISGSVIDADSGKPLAATVTFPDHPELGTRATAPRTGAFSLARVPAGAVTVEASAEGYENGRVPLMVENRKLATALIRLSRAVAPVEVTGRVSDRKTGAPLAATVMVAEQDSAVHNTDPATGIYGTRLMPGGYTLTVESPGYLKQSAWVLVERDLPLVRDFRLVNEHMIITLRGIHFDFDKATIKPESRPALEDAAKILDENPTIKAAIQGHTDSMGSDKYNLRLSERRAQAVVGYLVSELGIDASRLTARGYGEAKPVADNKTEEGRAINRRVEFVILGEIGKK